MPRALITGASSGIGKCFAEQLAAQGYDITLVARNVARLEEVKSELTNKYGTSVDAVVANLETPEGVEVVEQLLRDESKQVDFLINNAGFGIKGDFVATPIAEHLDVMAVNAIAVLRLTHVALEVMLPRKSGDILNVSSVAAFTPGVRPSSTYAAAKAFVAAFTEGLFPLVRGTGVHMSVVCPGWTRSAFHSNAGIGASKIPGFMWLEPSEVARVALKDHRAGKVVSVPSLIYKVIIGVCRALPRPLITAVTNLVGRLSH